MKLSLLICLASNPNEVALRQKLKIFGHSSSKRIQMKEAIDSCPVEAINI